ncbi:MAG: DUF1266 domain-containing protein [Candidatus Accumulibacter sp.]|jgi:hypothetical protein|nr:DUF1266 domain-containing protein [Accumulibacter sp.]
MLDGEHDVYTKDDIIGIFIKEPVVEDVDSRETFIEYYEQGEQNDYTLENDTFPGLAEQMERALEREWSFIAEKRAYPDAVKWFNACNAVVLIAGEQNPAIFGGAYKNPDDVAGWREVLYDSWQINNRSQLLVMLPKLIGGRAVTIYKAQRMVLDGADMQEAIERFAGSFAEDDLGALRQGVFNAGRADGDADSDERAIFDAIAKGGGESCMWAWDLQRAIYLSAMGDVADFLSWDEAMDFCRQAGQKLQGVFTGWDSFMRGYLLGYCLWAGERLDDEDG